MFPVVIKPEALFVVFCLLHAFLHCSVPPCRVGVVVVGVVASSWGPFALVGWSGVEGLAVVPTTWCG